MKVKTSVTLSKDLVREMDKLSDQFGNRSAFVEHAIRTFLASIERQARDARDLQILNEQADALNAEAEDVLRYQAEL